MTALIQIGLGAWGLDWAQTILPQLPDAEIEAWVDADSAARDSFSSATGADPKRIFSTIAEAFARTSAVGAIAPVAISAHAAVAREVLALGKHLLIEKPFTLDVTTARELSETAAAQGLVLAVDQNYRFFPGAPALRTLVDEASVGHLRHISVTWHRAHPGVRDSDPLVELAVHHFDLMRYVLRSDAIGITVTIVGDEPQREPQTRSVRAVIEFASGAIVDYLLTSQGVAPATPWPGHWIFAGDNGSIEWGTTTIDGTEPEHSYLRRTDADGAVTVLDIAPLALFERAGVLRTFLDAIDTGSMPSSPAEDNARTIAVLEAAMRSRASGRREDVERW